MNVMEMMIVMFVLIYFLAGLALSLHGAISLFRGR
jgi:hypothetical protein